MELRYACPECGTVNRRSDADQVAVLDCIDCSYVGLLPEDWTEAGIVKCCPICGCDELFTQRDFRRRTGIVIALVGASLARFTRYLSLFFAAALCAVLYLASKERLVCYLCRSQFLGHRPSRSRRRFDPRVAEGLQNDSDPEPKPSDSQREIR